MFFLRHHQQLFITKFFICCLLIIELFIYIIVYIIFEVIVNEWLIINNSNVQCLTRSSHCWVNTNFGYVNPIKSFLQLIKTLTHIQKFHVIISIVPSNSIIIFYIFIYFTPCVTMCTFASC